MNSKTRFRSDIPVTLFREASCGSDLVFCKAAWAEPPYSGTHDESEEGKRRLIRTLIRKRHTSPLEKGLLTVYIEAPMVVWWELTRHRFMGSGAGGGTDDFSFSLSSGRYKVLDGEFYVTPEGRDCFEPKKFRPMNPRLVSAKEYLQEVSPIEDTFTDTLGYETNLWLGRAATLAALPAKCQREVSEFGYAKFTEQIENGVAREVARNVLPPNVYYSGYVEAKPLTWLSFFSLRTDDPRNEYPTRPQHEIEVVSRACEKLFEMYWPITYDEFNQAGRAMADLKRRAAESERGENVGV